MLQAEENKRFLKVKNLQHSPAGGGCISPTKTGQSFDYLEKLMAE